MPGGLQHPREPKTWAERFRQRRMDLGFTQATLAVRLGRTAWAVADWESGATKPLASSWGAIARVLGSDFLPDGAEIGSRLRVTRWRLGLTQAELAAKVGLDPRTVRNTEQGRYRPSRGTLAKLESVLSEPCRTDMETKRIHLHSP